MLELTKRRREIVEAALTLVAQGGKHNLTTKKIAAEVGLSEAGLYRHFASKTEILNEITRLFDEEAESFFNRNSGRGLAGIEAFVKSRFQRVAEKPILAHVLFSEELFVGNEEREKLLRDMMRRHRTHLAQFFKDAKKNDDVRSDIPNDTLFLLVFGPVRLLVKQWGLSDGAFDLVHEGNELWKALVKTLR